eukprot:g17607.t1
MRAAAGHDVSELEARLPRNRLLHPFDEEFFRAARGVASASLAASIASVILNPFDVVKLQQHVADRYYRSTLHALTKIAAEDGLVRGLWMPGLTASVCRDVINGGLRVGCYPMVKDVLEDVFIGSDHPGSSAAHTTESATLSFCAGLLTGMFGSFAANPFDLIKVRFQAEAGKIVEAAPEISYAHLRRLNDTVDPAMRAAYPNYPYNVPPSLREAGAGSSGLVLEDPDPRRSFSSFESYLKRLRNPSASSAADFFLSPEKSVRHVYVTGLYQGSEPQFRSTAEAFFGLQTDRQLFRGVVPNMLRASFVTAAQITSYERSKRYLVNDPRFLLEQGPLLFALCGAVSGFCSSVVSAPVDLVKTRVMNDRPTGLLLGQEREGFQFKSAKKCFFATIKRDGMFALYRGFTATLLRLGPHFMLGWPLLELIRKHVLCRGNLSVSRKVGPEVTRSLWLCNRSHAGAKRGAFATEDMQEAAFPPLIRVEAAAATKAGLQDEVELELRATANLEDFIEIFFTGPSPPSDELSSLWQDQEGRPPEECLPHFFFRKVHDRRTSRRHGWAFELLELMKQQLAAGNVGPGREKLTAVLTRLVEAVKGDMKVLKELLQWKEISNTSDGASKRGKSVLETFMEKPSFWNSCIPGLRPMLGEQKEPLHVVGNASCGSTAEPVRRPDRQGDGMNGKMPAPSPSGCAAVAPFVDQILRGNPLWGKYIGDQLNKWTERLTSCEVVDEGCVEYQREIDRTPWRYCRVQWRPVRPCGNIGREELQDGDADSVEESTIGYGIEKNEAELVARARILEAMGLCRDFTDMRAYHLSHSTPQQGDLHCLHFLPAIFWSGVVLEHWHAACRQGRDECRSVVDAIHEAGVAGMRLLGHLDLEDEDATAGANSPAEAVSFLELQQAVAATKQGAECRSLPSKFLPLEVYEQMCTTLQYLGGNETNVAHVLESMLRMLVTDPRTCPAHEIGGAEYQRRQIETMLLEGAAQVDAARQQAVGDTCLCDQVVPVGDTIQLRISIDLAAFLNKTSKSSSSSSPAGGCRLLGTLLHVESRAGRGAGRAGSFQPQSRANPLVVTEVEEASSGIFEIVGPADLDDIFEEYSSWQLGGPSTGSGRQRREERREIEVEYRPTPPQRGFALASLSPPWPNFGGTLAVWPLQALVRLSAQRQARALANLCMKVQESHFDVHTRRRILMQPRPPEGSRQIPPVYSSPSAAKPNLYRVGGQGVSTSATRQALKHGDYVSPKVFGVSDIRRASTVEHTKLGQGQQEAIVASQNTRSGEIVLIQGPPATGKTSVAAEIVYNWYESDRGGERRGILAVAQSNVAANVLAGYLWDRSLPAIRVGRDESMQAMAAHSNDWLQYLNGKNDRRGVELMWKFVRWHRLLDEFVALSRNDVRLHKFTLEKLRPALAQFADEEIAKDRKQKLGQRLRSRYSMSSDARDHDLHAPRPSPLSPGRTTVDYRDAKSVLNLVHRSLLRQLLDGHSRLPVVTTNDGAGHDMLLELSKDSFKHRRRPRFCSLLVDEAAQSTELATLVPLQHGPHRVVLIGDNNQLPAVVLSARAKQNYGADVSLFERLMSNRDLPIILQLDVQRRMHSSIALFPNTQMYEKEIRNELGGAGVRHERDARPVVKGWPWPRYDDDSSDCFRVAFVDTDQDTLQRRFAEKTDPATRSKNNPHEADLVLSVAQALLLANPNDLAPGDIGIITPYNEQKRELKGLRDGAYSKAASFSGSGARGRGDFSQIFVDTVDGFQGSEREVILLSLTRTSGPGFLTDSRRINVALTRARRGLVVFGSGRVLKGEGVGKTAPKGVEAETGLSIFMTRNDAVYTVDEAEEAVRRCCVEAEKSIFVGDHVQADEQLAGCRLHVSPRYLPPRFANIRDPTRDGGRERERVLGGAHLVPISQTAWRNLKCIIVDSGNVLHFNCMEDAGPNALYSGNNGKEDAIADTRGREARDADLAKGSYYAIWLAQALQKRSPEARVVLPIVGWKWREMRKLLLGGIGISPEKRCGEILQQDFAWTVHEVNGDIDQYILRLASDYLAHGKTCRVDELCIVSNDKYVKEASAFPDLPLAQLRVGFTLVEPVDDEQGEVFLGDKFTEGSADEPGAAGFG